MSRLFVDRAQSDIFFVPLNTNSTRLRQRFMEGTEIGPYRIEEQLGAGGMGAEAFSAPLPG